MREGLQRLLCHPGVEWAPGVPPYQLLQLQKGCVHWPGQ